MQRGSAPGARLERCADPHDPIDATDFPADPGRLSCPTAFGSGAGFQSLGLAPGLAYMIRTRQLIQFSILGRSRVIGTGGLLRERWRSTC